MDGMWFEKTFGSVGSDKLMLAHSNLNLLSFFSSLQLLVFLLDPTEVQNEIWGGRGGQLMLSLMIEYNTHSE